MADEDLLFAGSSLLLAIIEHGRNPTKRVKVW